MKSRILVTILAAAAGTARAAVPHTEPIDVDLGLWEVTHTTETKGALPFDTSKLTPEQRARIEQALKANQGARTRTIRSCLTKEKRDKELFPTEKEDANCKRVVLSSSRKELHVRMECKGERTITGDIRFEAVSRQRVKGKAHVTTGDGSRSMTVDTVMDAKWIGSDCGNIK